MFRLVCGVGLVVDLRVLVGLVLAVFGWWFRVCWFFRFVCGGYRCGVICYVTCMFTGWSCFSFSLSLRLVTIWWLWVFGA